MTLWVLLMVLISPTNGFSPEQYLNKFDTSDECVSEMLRISGEMAKAYPGDKDYRIICREKVTKEEEKAPVPEAVAPAPVTKEEYNVIIVNFSKFKYPKERLSIKVTEFKPLENETGSLPIFALQIHITHKGGVNSYILIVKGKTLLGWIDAGEVDPQEEEAGDEEEEFPAKDQA
jgi:hypothetical protein